MKRLTLFMMLSVLACSSKVWSQTDFRPGYYITSAYDTIYGFIDYRGDIRNSKTCDFRTAPDRETVSFKPGEILGYRYDKGKYYISKTLESDGETKQLFLEYLVDGIADLYYFRDEKDDYYVLESENGDMEILTNEESIIEKDGVSYAWESHSYIATLKTTFGDCWDIQPELDHAQLTHKSLINLTSEYHDYVCDGEKCIIYQKEIPLLKVNFGVTAGFSSSGLNFVRHTNYQEYDFRRSWDPVLGLQLNLNSPRISERIAVILRTEWTKSYFFGYLEDPYSPTIIYHNDVHIRLSSARLAIGMNYTFPRGTFRPTVGGGYLINRLLDYDMSRLVETEAPDVIFTHEYFDKPQRDMTMGFFVQLGTQYELPWGNFIHCFLRYHYTSETISDRIIMNSYSINLGYFL